MYHMISEPLSEKDVKYACPKDRFHAHMKYLQAGGFNIVSMDDIYASIHDKKDLPGNPIAITIDDGFRDNYDNAFPVFQELNIPATIFLATGSIGKTNAWMERNNFPSRDMLTWDMVGEMDSNNITFGAHTISHARLSELDTENAYIEISQSKQEIDERLSKETRYFAYPYGLMNEETPGLVKKAGFKLACSTRSGFNNHTTDPFLLRRIEVYGNDPVWKLAQKIKYGMNNASIMFPLSYYWKRLGQRLWN